MKHPFLYQAWKHHAPFLRARLAKVRDQGHREVEVSKGVQRMGDSVTDLYIGELSIDELSGELKTLLGEPLLSSPDRYRNWLGEEGYRILCLSDSSRWVLKDADELDRWIHLHPARHSPLSIRVRGKTLRTAFLVHLEAAHYGMDPLDKGLVDHVRANYLQLPPLRSLDRKRGLGRLIELLWVEGSSG